MSVGRRCFRPTSSERWRGDQCVTVRRRHATATSTTTASSMPNETGELNDDAVGFHITDLDVGIALMVSTNLGRPGRLSRRQARRPQLRAGRHRRAHRGRRLRRRAERRVRPDRPRAEPRRHRFRRAASTRSARCSTSSTRTRQQRLSRQTELNAALATAYTGASLTTVQQLITVLNIGGAPPLGGPSVTDVLGKLSTSFKTRPRGRHSRCRRGRRRQARSRFRSQHRQSRRAGSPRFRPIPDQHPARRRNRAARTYSACTACSCSRSTTGLKAFVAAGLEFGPDVGASQGSKLFVMHALGALVINGRRRRGRHRCLGLRWRRVEQRPDARRRRAAGVQHHRRRPDDHHPGALRRLPEGDRPAKLAAADGDLRYRSARRPGRAAGWPVYAGSRRLGDIHDPGRCATAGWHLRCRTARIS